MAKKPNKTRKSNHYVTDRFNDLKYIGNPIFNHKLEQVCRSVLFPEQIFSDADYQLNYKLAVSARHAQVLTEQHPLDVVAVGLADAYGYRLHPATNSWLIRNGIKPNVVLFHLSILKLEGAPVLVEDRGRLYVPFAALHHVLHGILFNKQLFVDQYNAYIRKYGYPEHWHTRNQLED